MGIQGFFNNFKEKSISDSNPFKFIVGAEIEPDVSRIYVDFISIIFDLIVDFPDLLNNRNDGVQEILIDQVNIRLETITSFYPNASIYIYFEAIPTIAKTVEQYARRIFRKILSDVKEDLKTKLLLNFQEFDYALISFNSPFINILADRIYQYFTDKGKEIFIEKFNPATNNVGEAEHRIIHHIANNCIEPNNKFVIYSPDADVFILSTLLTNNLTIEGRNVLVNTLRRSEPDLNIQTGRCTRTYFSIKSSVFINYLYSKIISASKNKKRLVADILFVFNILGDDFIPLFKNFTIRQIDILYEAYTRLPLDVYILDYNVGENKFNINKDNLLRFFQTPEMMSIDSLENKLKYYPPQAIEKPNSYFETNFYNRIVYDFLIENFESGYFFNESAKKIPPNGQNFGFKSVATTVPRNYNIRYDDPQVYTPTTNSSFLLAYLNTKKNTKKIIVNEANYYNINLVRIGSLVHSHEDVEPNIIVTNYLEGYQFILDLYFNDFGVVRNNFWYFRYLNTPTIEQLIRYLQINDLPTYIVSNNPPYFTGEEYQNYLASLVDRNYAIAKKAIQDTFRKRIDRIGYNDIVLLRGRGDSIIFDCVGKKYLNKCTIIGETIETPFNFLTKSRGVPTIPIVSLSRPIVQPRPVIPSPVLEFTSNSASNQVNPIPNMQGLDIKAKPFIPRGGPKPHLQGDSQQQFKLKYLKYKQKYLELKNKYTTSK